MASGSFFSFSHNESLMDHGPIFLTEMVKHHGSIEQVGIFSKKKIEQVGKGKVRRWWSINCITLALEKKLGNKVENRNPCPKN